LYFSDPGKITGIEKSSKSYEHGSDRIEPPGIESSFDSFVCGHSSRRNKRRDNRIRFSTSLSHVESATIEADILFDVFPPMRQDNSTNQEFCKSANLLSSDWVFTQLKRGIWTCFKSSGEKSSDASRRRWKRSSQTASYAQRNSVYESDFRYKSKNGLEAEHTTEDGKPEHENIARIPQI